MTVNVPLLRKTLEHIEAHPQEWYQNTWRCDTAMCFAGTACHLDGGEWVRDGSSPWLAQRDGEAPDDLHYAPAGWVHAETRARRILGLDPWPAAGLFHYRNTLDDLREQVAELCGGEL
jgi:hypothetical protein